MRRKLIKQDVFEQIANSSVTTAEHELVEAASVLAKALSKDTLTLHSFNESTVMYETLDDTYVHAGYEIKQGQISFNDIEELVVDHDSKKSKMKSILSEMIDSILVDDTKKADLLFENYLGMYSFSEAKKNLFGKDDKPNLFTKGKKPSFGKKDKEDKGNPFKKKDADFPEKLKKAGKICLKKVY